jgi:hypothetical protein
MKNKKNTKMGKASETKVWLKPSIKKLGNAKDIVAQVNIVGGGDLQYSVLLPS